MDYNDADIVGKMIGDAVSQKPGLDAGTAEALNTMSAGAKHQNRRCRSSAQQSDVGEEAFSFGSPNRVLKGNEFDVSGLCRAKEFLPCLRVGR